MFALRLLTAPEPFIPLAVLREPVVGRDRGAGFFSVGVIIGLTIFMPLYFELVLGFSPSGSGIALIVFLAGATVGSFFAGRLMVRLTHYKLRAARSAWRSASWCSRCSRASRPGCRSSRCALLGCSAAPASGAMYPVTTTIVQNAVAPHQLGTATGALNFARQLGGAIIVAAFGAIVLGGIDTGGQADARHAARRRGTTRAELVARLFRWVFVAGAVFLAVALVRGAADRGAAAARARRESRLPHGRMGVEIRRGCGTMLLCSMPACPLRSGGLRRDEFVPRRRARAPRPRRAIERAAEGGRRASDRSRDAGSAADAHGRPRLSHAEVRKIFFGLMLAAFLAALNQTIVATALPTIGRALRRFRESVLDRHRLSADVDRGGAALRQALRHLRPPRHDAGRDRPVHRGLGCACARAPDMMLAHRRPRRCRASAAAASCRWCSRSIADVVAPRERGHYQAYMGIALGDRRRRSARCSAASSPSICTGR